MPCCSCVASTRFHLLPPVHRPAPLSLPPLFATRQRTRPQRTPRLIAALSDPFVLELAEKLEDSLSSSPSPLPLRTLRDSSSNSLLSTPWPSRKSEPFRFTDISYLRAHTILPAQPFIPTIPRSPMDSPFATSVVLINGLFSPSLSTIANAPQSVFIGSIDHLPPSEACTRVTELLTASSEFDYRDLFWDFNSIGAPDILVVYVPAEAKIKDQPIHLQFGYSCEVGEEDGTGLSMSNPRVLVVAEKGAEVSIVEEHFAVDGVERGRYWSNSVAEVILGEGASVAHMYVQNQSLDAAHVKWTVVRQELRSTYEFVELSTGGKLSRHNLHIQQLGPDTNTELAAFHLSSQSKQIHDMHSRLVLDHPRGYSRQLHKCIVCNSGHVIFDGNIKVNRYAQKTDAGQSTKGLLLAPKAIINAKPNLQIIADDVKCTHGAAISDLSKEELFYFQTRGVNAKTARDALIFSFGAQVIERIPFKPIREKVANRVKDLLKNSRKSVQ